MAKRKTSVFVWRSRLATSDERGDGFFTIVGGYDVLVLVDGKPATGGMIVASSEAELAEEVEKMLVPFKRHWLTQSRTERRRNLAIAAETARQSGWTDRAALIL